ncbi:hypothetical protein DMN91_011801 [Ooceraea biroi]|uniref:Uncharacterized protein n=1 Tax=Ooceraea biroi TaxID=2015173 RepID=A0A3L8D7H3_OOCBI|nr:hypothetical protein DMN91_011801 [Ooceraea biroi]
MVKKRRHRAGRRKRERIEYLQRLRQEQYLKFLKNLNRSDHRLEQSTDQVPSTSSEGKELPLSPSPTSSNFPHQNPSGSGDTSAETEDPGTGALPQPTTEESEIINLTCDESDIEFIEEIELIQNPRPDPIVNAYFMKLERFVRITLIDNIKLVQMKWPFFNLNFKALFDKLNTYYINQNSLHLFQCICSNVIQVYQYHV